MILGDNIYFSSILEKARRGAEKGRAPVFGYYVPDPECFGMESLLEAAKFIHMVEKRQGMKISAPGGNRVPFLLGISTQELLESADLYGISPYGHHLRQVPRKNSSVSKSESRSMERK